MRFGYARVSRTDQNLELQTDELRKSGAVQIFSDKVSGAQHRRVGLDRLLEVAREGDEIVVWKLDRLGRSLKNLMEVSAELDRRGIQLISIKENIDTTTTTGRLFFHIFGALAECERGWIIERTRAGLQAAKARGHTGGRRPLLNAEQVAFVRQRIDSGEGSQAIARLLKCSERTIRRIAAGEYASA